jgi:hypothetical protein
MMYLIYSKNFCKCHNVPPTHPNNEKRENWINLKIMVGRNRKQSGGKNK